MEKATTNCILKQVTRLIICVPILWTTHEVLGIIISILFILHIFLNWLTLKGLIKKRRKLIKDKIRLFLDISLMIIMPISIISGLIISNILKLPYNEIVFNIHKLSSYIGMVNLIFHIAEHAKYIYKVFGLLIKSNFFRVLSKVFSLISSIGFIIAIIFILIKPTKTTSFNTNSIQITKSIVTSPIPIISFTPKASPMPTISASYVPSTKNKETLASNTTMLEIATPSLEEYLSKLFCSGCRKRCPLTNLKCSRGDSYLEQASQEYAKIYSDQK